MNKSESAVLEAKTPEEYIDRSLKAKLSPAAKAHLARTWMESTGYSKEDILRARNRHPYWKRKKMEGSAERTRRRLAAHDYSGGASVNWNRALVTEFLGLNGKDSFGRYELKDWQLAERFGATIPSIQYMRRKLRKVRDILGMRSSSEKVVDYLLRAESVLSRGKGAVEQLQKSERGKAFAAATKSGSVKKAPKAPAKGLALKMGGAAKTRGAKSGAAAAGAAKAAAAKKPMAGKAGAAKAAAPGAAKAGVAKAGAAKAGAAKAAAPGAAKAGVAKAGAAKVAAPGAAKSAAAGKGGQTAKRASSGPKRSATPKR
jgi:hypothetical protein